MGARRPGSSPQTRRWGVTLLVGVAQIEKSRTLAGSGLDLSRDLLDAGPICCSSQARMAMSGPPLLPEEAVGVRSRFQLQLGPSLPHL
jgi:hypothetical protein